MTSKSKKNIFISNALLLSFVNIIMRGISVSFNAFVNNKIGSESMGLFTLVMSVYSFALTVALSCVNLGAVRLTSERCAQLENCDELSWKYALKHVMRSVCLYGLLFGSAAGFLLFSVSGMISQYLLKDTRTLISLKLLALSLPMISLSSAVSGYFTGLRKVSKNAIAAVSEQFFKIIVTSTALAMIHPGNVEFACTAVVGGAALSEAWSLICNIFMYITDTGKPAGIIFGNEQKRLHTRFSDVAEISLPAAIGAYARQGLSTLEHLAIPEGLRKFGLPSNKALSSYGLLQGIAFPLVMFPYAVIGSFTSLLIPEISEKHALDDKTGIMQLTEKVYRYSACFSVCACGIFVNFAEERGVMIYNSSEAAAYTLFLGLLVPFMYLDTAVEALLKGLGEQLYVMKINIIDSAGGLLLVIFLTPVMGIWGYIAAVWICEIGNLAASIYKLGRITDAGISLSICCHFKPILCAVAASVINTIMTGIIPTYIAVAFFAVIYIVLYVITEKKLVKGFHS